MALQEVGQTKSTYDHHFVVVEDQQIILETSNDPHMISKDQLELPGLGNNEKPFTCNVCGASFKYEVGEFCILLETDIEITQHIIILYHTKYL